MGKQFKTCCIHRKYSWRRTFPSRRACWRSYPAPARVWWWQCLSSKSGQVFQLKIDFFSDKSQFASFSFPITLKYTTYLYTIRTAGFSTCWTRQKKSETWVKFFQDWAGLYTVKRIDIKYVRTNSVHTYKSNKYNELLESRYNTPYSSHSLNF